MQCKLPLDKLMHLAAGMIRIENACHLMSVKCLLHMDRPNQSARGQTVRWTFKTVGVSDDCCCLIVT